MTYSLVFRIGGIIGVGLIALLVFVLMLFSKFILGIPAVILGIFLCGIDGYGGNCHTSPEFFYFLAFLLYLFLGGFIGILIGTIVWGIKEIIEYYKRV